MMLQSHYKPYKSLKQHISEVSEASRLILSHHSTEVNLQINDWLKYAVEFHDLGKATKEFQRYIHNPPAYREDSKKKAHTPVSLFWWCAYAVKKQIEPLTVIAVAAAIWKHHGNFPIYPNCNGLESAIDTLDDDLLERLSEFPAASVNEELGIRLKGLSYEELQESYIENFFHENGPQKMDIENAAKYRLRVQLLFSILLEADRAFLVLSDEFLKRYRDRKYFILPLSLVDEYFSSKGSIGNSSELNELRTKVRLQILEKNFKKISTLTLPTGIGKTMIAAAWALKYRSDEFVRGKTRKVIIVMPFLSIIDQTVTEYEKLFKNHPFAELILEAHSLAERIYSHDAEEEEHNKVNGAIDFFADTWIKPYIITTFDQFLLALLSSKGAHQLRFHNLADALIIMDEIQAIPTQLWRPMSLALNGLVNELNSHVLIMSATQPDFIENAAELANSSKIIFKKFKRYQIILRLDKMTIDEFIDSCQKRICSEWKGKRILIVLNTRASARRVYDGLNKVNSGDLFFISADVIPKERLKQIDSIKRNKPCIVVSTQCIEAGVDIDMDCVIRDFSPLDSIIQAAGRCNRNGNKDRGTVEVVRLINEKDNRFYHDYVYDQILSSHTLSILKELDDKILMEENIYPLIDKYYNIIKTKKDTGREYAENWAWWKEELNIARLLRSDIDRIQFIVLSQDSVPKGETTLDEAIKKAMKIEDRWESRRALKALSSRIAKLTISIWARQDFCPEEIADKLGPWWLLKNGYYQPYKGLNMSDISSENQSYLNV